MGAGVHETTRALVGLPEDYAGAVALSDTLESP